MDHFSFLRRSLRLDHFTHSRWQISKTLKNVASQNFEKSLSRSRANQRLFQANINFDFDDNFTIGRGRLLRANKRRFSSLHAHFLIIAPGRQHSSFRMNIAAVASRFQHCVRLDRPAVLTGVTARFVVIQRAK